MFNWIKSYWKRALLGVSISIILSALTTLYDQKQKLEIEVADLKSNARIYNELIQKQNESITQLEVDTQRRQQEVIRSVELARINSKKYLDTIKQLNLSSPKSQDMCESANELINSYLRGLNE